MILSPAVRKRFNDLNQAIFGRVDIPKTPLIMNGSYPYSPWAGDIDLYVPLTKSQVALVCDVVRLLAEDTHDVKLHRVRIGDKVLFKDFCRNLENPAEVQHTIFKAPRGKRWIKVNLLVFTGEDIEDVSILYNMDSDHPLSPNTIRRSIRADIKKYAEVPDFYKMLRRERLLERPGSTRRKYLERILINPESGMLYLARVRAESLEISRGLGFSRKQISTALGNLRELIRVKLGLSSVKVTMDTLSKLSESLRILLNEKLQHR